MNEVKDTFIRPDGRWEMTVEIKDPELWKRIKRNQVVGMSIDAHGGRTWIEVRQPWYRRLWYWVRAMLPW